MAAFRPTPKNTRLANHLRSLRMARGVKAKFIAERMGISKSLLCHLEAGRRLWTDKYHSDFLNALTPENQNPKKQSPQSKGRGAD